MKSEKGFTLIEIVIAIALLGIIAAGFLVALSGASKALILADERTTAESLARSQMEHVKEQPYDFADDYIPGSPPVGGEVTYAKIDDDDIPEGYTIWSANRDGDIVNGDDSDGIIGIPWDSQTNQPVDTEDVGLQRIKLVIYHYDKVVITLEGYKVDR